MVFVSDQSLMLRKDLSELHLDESPENEEVWKDWCEFKTMSHAYDDVLSVAGPGLLEEKPEGAAIAEGDIRQDLLTRHFPKTYAKMIIITQEAEDDGKYPEALDAAKMLLMGGRKTRDYVTSLMLVNGFNTAFPVSDDVALWSASHTLPGGGVFSNLVATPMSPSRLLVTTARTMAMKMPGRDGTLCGTDLEAIVFPVDQWDSWDVICGSKNAPEAGEFNAINVVERMKLKLVPNPYWQNTTTACFFKTKEKGGFSYRERKKFTTRTWVDNDAQVLKYSVSFRMAAGLPSNPRATIGNNA